MSENIDDEEVREVLSSGTDVREYSQQVEKEFKDVENRSIEDYIKGENFCCLFLSTCSHVNLDILARVKEIDFISLVPCSQ